MDVDLDKESDVEPAAPSKKIPLQAKGKDKTATEMYQKVFCARPPSRSAPAH
jgi:hypothetical protein